MDDDDLAGARPVGPGPIALLVNPAAGRRHHSVPLAAISAALRATGRPVRQLAASTSAEALFQCRAAVTAGADVLVTVGGDGTVHLALQAVAERNVALGIVPAGTGDDLASGLGLPADPIAATRTIVAAIRAGRARAVDLAKVTAGDGRSRWYAGVLAAGFDAAVNARANRMRFPSGPSRYHLAIPLELARLRARQYTLRLDGVESRVDAVVVAIANTGCYGGGLRICPDADPCDGWLDVAVGRAMGRIRLARLAPALRTGRHLEHPLVTVTRARQIELAVEGVTTFADGEELFVPPISVRCVPGALTLLG